MIGGVPLCPDAVTALAGFYGDIRAGRDLEATLAAIGGQCPIDEGTAWVRMPAKS
jgi:hypothetical protein